MYEGLLKPVEMQRSDRQSFCPQEFTVYLKLPHVTKSTCKADRGKASGLWRCKRRNDFDQGDPGRPGFVPALNHYGWMRWYFRSEVRARAEEKYKSGSRTGVVGMRVGTWKWLGEPRAEGLDGHLEQFIGTAENWKPLAFRRTVTKTPPVF